MTQLCCTWNKYCKTQALVTCVKCKKIKCNVCMNISLSHAKTLRENSWYCLTPCTQEEDQEPIVMNPTITDIYKTMREVLSSQKFLSAKFDEFKAQQEVNTEKIKVVEKKSITNENQISLLNKRVRSLESTLTRCEGEAIKDNVVITNIPGTDLSIENLFAIICDKISFNANGKIKELRSITPASNKKPKRTHSIVIKFINGEVKREFLSKKKEYGVVFAQNLGLLPSPTDTEHRAQIQLYFRDEITKQQMNLYERVREWKLEHQFKFTWIQKGQIMLRKDETGAYHKITSEDDLIELASKLG